MKGHRRAERLPDPPELPESARPPWPAWYAPAEEFFFRGFFNTFATLGISPVPAIVVGALVVLRCVLTPRQFGRWPTRLPA